MGGALWVGRYGWGAMGGAHADRLVCFLNFDESVNNPGSDVTQMGIVEMTIIVQFLV